MRETPMRFPLELFGSLDVGLGDDAVGQQALDAADYDRVFVALHEGSSNARRTDHSHLAVARQNSRHRRRTWSDENQRNLQIIFLEKTRLFGDPRVGLGHHPGGVDRK